jgi:ParB-like chromosome segregation protein Spo0J
MNYKFHPLADVLPLIEGAEFERLVADIATNGLLNAITIHDDMILDGRNRERACRAAGVEPRYVEFEGKEASLLQPSSRASASGQ